MDNELDSFQDIKNDGACLPCYKPSKILENHSVVFAKNDKGFQVLHMKTTTMLSSINNAYAAGVCDSCNCGTLEGFYIPVLAGRWYCRSCYERWLKDAVNYEEDKAYEEEILNQMLSSLRSLGCDI